MRSSSEPAGVRSEANGAIHALVDPGLPEPWVLPPPRALPRHIGEVAERAALRAKAQRLEREGADAEDCARALAMLAKSATQSHLDYAEALDAMGRSLELRFDRALCEEAVALNASCGNFRAAADSFGLGAGNYGA
ncbi:MAG: hypothetical protein QM784_12625 [Polyangiaceae bacterium]